jgi:dephospho-CoA kinase
VSEKNNLKIIAFVGLAGSGNSTVVKHLAKEGIPKIYFGEIIYKAMEEAGIEITWENQQVFREEVRKKEGTNFVVKRVIKEIHNLVNAGQRRIVLDGLYTWSEYRALKHEFPGEITVIAVVAPKHLRYQRMAHRPQRPMIKKEVDTRDWSEIENLEKGGPIAIADYYVVNDTTKESLFMKVDSVLDTINFYN